MTRFANFLARVSLWLGMILPIITLVFEGLTQPNGYTEPLLHKYRLQFKAA